jgi:hypothetical protein
MVMTLDLVVSCRGVKISQLIVPADTGAMAADEASFEFKKKISAKR